MFHVEPFSFPSDFAQIGPQVSIGPQISTMNPMNPAIISAINEAIENLEAKERDCREKALKAVTAAEAYHDAQIQLRYARNQIVALEKSPETSAL